MPKPKPKTLRWTKGAFDEELVAYMPPSIGLGIVAQATGYLYFAQSTSGANTVKGVAVQSGFATTLREAKAKAKALGLKAQAEAKKHHPKYFGATIRCNACGVSIQSKHRHDFQVCQCNPWQIAVDGGGDYLRMNYTEKADWTVVKEGRYLIDETK